MGQKEKERIYSAEQKSHMEAEKPCICRISGVWQLQLNPASGHIAFQAIDWIWAATTIKERASKVIDSPQYSTTMSTSTKVISQHGLLSQRYFIPDKDGLIAQLRRGHDIQSAEMIQKFDQPSAAGLNTRWKRVTVKTARCNITPPDLFSLKS
jgi:hypothetical protein